MRVAAHSLARSALKALTILLSAELPPLGIAPNAAPHWRYAARFS